MALAAVVHLRTVYVDIYFYGNSLISSCTREDSNLELCSAVLLSKLLATVKTTTVKIYMPGVTPLLL